MHTLRVWAKGGKNLEILPTRKEAPRSKHGISFKNRAFDLNYLKNAVALEDVKRTRVPVYPRNWLRRGTTRTRIAAGKKTADAEHQRKEEMAGLFEEPSWYYPLKVAHAEWTSTELLLEGKHESDH